MRLKLEPTNKKALYRRALANKGLKGLPGHAALTCRRCCAGSQCREAEKELEEVTVPQAESGPRHQLPRTTVPITEYPSTQLDGHTISFIMQVLDSHLLEKDPNLVYQHQPFAPLTGVLKLLLGSGWMLRSVVVVVASFAASSVAVRVQPSGHTRLTFSSVMKQRGEPAPRAQGGGGGVGEWGSDYSSLSLGGRG
ncbi:sperm-associated antigen 1 isoform X1 [Lates japonicus]|uniref:Sperm-associated antigen 1 isoform X1 n=1 Tax=Lates japonicus TaxID=270547 RepID=A0AAD3QYU1_LATJO|nr:sperm-associated antigen 1 isoform X1 [Lates japonicus]